MFARLQEMKTFFFRLSLSQQFMLLSFPILLAGTLFIGRWIGQQVEDSVVHRMGGVTALYVDSFIAPHVQALLRTDEIPESDRDALIEQLRQEREQHARDAEAALAAAEAGEAPPSDEIVPGIRDPFRR